MAANRKLPFGYTMRMGKACIDEREAGLVKEIFSDYIRGASFQQLTEKLNGQPVAYNPQTRWNKNMVARILEDRRYVGEKDFPLIIEQALLDAALERRACKQTAQLPSEMRKTLRQLGGQKATPQMEQAILALLQRLIRQPECVQIPYPVQTNPEEERRLHQELDALMNRQPMEEENAKHTAYALAAARLNAIGSEDYETLRIKEVLTSEIPPHDLLKSIASAVLIRPDGSVGLRLKNGQIIERSKIS
ncbi:hypothetical protein DWV16_00070 [Anaerotruncus sp. AF02-27]|uniref:recombinase family protein n=1 Tax=Anaerotruncus sp. AF02-27 TaxID=2292191 RepID=UPI000E4A7E04|nr:recombinase family protein [Anaerotruncus sp. AF02-27]RGX56765.1 hypothetical protein DWV16_00070 [Anaerotruncus sp. AF02-27]